MNKRRTETKEQAYKLVFDELCQVGLFVGKYDAVHGNEHYMYGVNTVMEFIARSVSEECLGEFSDRFISNMLKSKDNANSLKEAYNDKDSD